MTSTEYTKIFQGNFILATRVIHELKQQGINPIVKDEGESQRLAGYASMNQGFQEVFVHQSELDKAAAIVAHVKGEMEV